MAYATAQQVIDRLGEQTLLYLVDRDADGVLSTAERAYITAECDEASRFIDAYLCTHFELPLTGTNLTNSTLTDWTIWLVAEALYTRLKRLDEATIRKVDLVRENLEKVRLGQFRIPNMVYPGDGFDDERRALGRPVVANPVRGRRVPRRRYR